MVSPDMYQAETIVSLIRHFGWNYISVLYSDGSYGLAVMQRILKLMEEFDICVA